MPGIGIGISPVLGNSIGSGGLSPIPFGVIFQSDFTLANWTHSGGATFSNDGTKIDVGGGAGNTTDIYYYNKYFTTLKVWKQKWYFIPKSAGFGISFGLQSLNISNVHNMINQLIMHNSTIGEISEFITGSTSASALSYTLNTDNLLMTIDRNYDIFTATIQNLTSPNTTPTYTFTANFYNTSGTILAPNTSAITIFAFGGTQTVTGFEFSSTLFKNEKTDLWANSKMEGYYAGSLYNTVCSILGIKNFAAGSNTTAELLLSVPELINSNPKNLLLIEVPRNDIALSIPTATWKSNYLSAVSQIESTGIKCWHMAHIPENNATDFSEIGNFINANFTRILRVSPTFDPLTMCSADTVHVNALGNADIANDLLTTYPALF